MYEGKPVVVSMGGGVNSTALLVGMLERGMMPDLTLFADTGAEEDHTYDHIQIVSKWCIENGMPPITTVFPTNKDGERITLVEDCLKRHALPGIAYGFKSCTERFKIRPQRKYIKTFQPIIDHWASGGMFISAIGLDFGEEHRTRLTFDHNFGTEYRYFLDDWQWRREECVKAICGAGLPQPGKSACFICSATKPIEIRRLARDYPDKMKIALEIEAGADLLTIKGLGRSFAWADVLKQGEMFDIGIADWQIPCECWDG